jgi:2-succinyl-6-hydroxy-2,4-cyclohexadiene-1-carboxylate synthase
MTRILALHGFLGRPSDWLPLRKEIVRCCSEVEFQTFDLYSLQSVRQKTPLEWAKKFNQLQKSKHVERNILMGYSLGGRLALQAAADKPGLWDEVILISAHPGLVDDEEKELRTKVDATWAEKFNSEKWHEVMKQWNNQVVFNESVEKH